MEGEIRGCSHVLAVDLGEISPFPPPPPALSTPSSFPPIQGNEVLLFSPISGYICTRLIKYSTSPLLPVGPAVLRGKGLYDSDRDSLCVAWKQQWGVDLSLAPLFTFPLLVLIMALRERKGRSLLHGLHSTFEAQMVTLLSLRGDMLPRSLLFAAWPDSPPVYFTWSPPHPSVKWAVSAFCTGGSPGPT